MAAPRRFTTALVAALLTLSLTSCEGDGDREAGERDPTATPSESPATPSPSPSSGTAPEVGPEVAPFLDRLKSGFGDEGSVHVRMVLSGPTRMTAEGDTSYGPDGSAMRMRMVMPQTGDGEMTMVVADEAVYLSMPGVTPAGKFFEVPEGSAILEGFDSGGMSPAESFAGFEAGLLEVEERGEQAIAGEPTDHVELTVDTERAMAAQGTELVPGLPETLTYDVWVDEEDRMRRIRYEVAGTEVVMDMTRWNSVKPITAPAPGDVVEAPEGL
jgi:hypothetical protein